jgi:hypothetical protein
VDNFYKSIERLTDQAMQGDLKRSHIQTFSQSIKAVCAILAKIETITITKALDRLDKVVGDMSVSVGW